jgi:hypothetical protein
MRTGVAVGDFPKISQPALRALRTAGCVRFGQLTGMTETELSKLHGMGPKALGLLREALALKSLSFKSE